MHGEGAGAMSTTERSMKGKSGLSIKRFFTRADANPYDEVEWEIRDAVIPNYKQGGNAFEQRGVEFPSSWSQNATNIVAQKYFRGPLGTPQRERSVRQLIDRVADAVSGWGWKDGYFATEEDRDAFTHELKHVLVTQKASFNSPVWFNVGVEPRPQCSACFILAVEDRMPSILNWYVEEGTIFKGGSGSGINLSTIRSSKEKLASGGEASGPVSFMRGADSSAGTIKSGGKCFRRGTLVATPGGWRAIEALRVGDLVLTHLGPMPVKDFMPNGRKLCYRVRTKEGYEVEVTQGHRFAFWDPELGVFDTKAIELFAPGDALYVLLEPSDTGTEVRLQVPEVDDPPHATTIEEMTFPSELSEEFAYVLGLLWGDGYVRRRSPYQVRIPFAKDEAGYEAADRFRKYCLQLFGEEPLTLGSYRGFEVLGYTRKRLVEFLVANDIAKGKSDCLGFPQALFRAEPAVRAAFVAGVIDADGCYQPRGGWCVSSVDRAFLVDLQRLLLSLGIPSKLKLSRSRQGTWRPLYRLSVAGFTFVDRLVTRIRPHSAKAARNYVASDGADKGWGYRPTLYGELASRARRRGGKRLIERTVGMNETTGYGALARVASHPDPEVSEYAATLGRCVQVTLESVEPTEVDDTYDIEVAEAHVLCANGLYASNTRRAAKMVILNVDHPDVEDFVWCKAIEERKARVLRDGGFDMDLDGRDSHSIQYQNANNSVRVTDDFMMAYVEDRDWGLRAVTTGDVLKVVRARDLMRQIAQAAWECADPGMQYDTTINAWHTAPKAGRINASNPCFTGDMRVHTDKGLIRFDDLVRRVMEGDTFEVYTHDATNPETPGNAIRLSKPTQFMVTGVNEILKLRFSDGRELRCTPGHRIWTGNRGWVRADELTARDEIPALEQATPAVMADHRIPVPSEWQSFASKGDRSAELCLPEKWDEDLAHFIGWLVGDGCISGNLVATVYGSPEDQREILPRHLGLVTLLNGGREPKPSVQENGTVQLRLSRRPLARFFEVLGVKTGRAAAKEVPWSIFEAPPEIARAFLRGLFDADGCAANLANGTRYVGLSSKSGDLLRGVQMLLAAEGIHARIYDVTGDNAGRSFRYARKDGMEVEYRSAGRSYDLRISGRDKLRFASAVGFDLPRKRHALTAMLGEHATYRAQRSARLSARDSDGFDLTYNLTEPLNHSYLVEGVVVRNCSEYMHLDNSACNLASLNLMKFLLDDGNFDIAGFRQAIDIVFLAQEILVGNSSYPTPKIERNAIDFRELGIGFANLGALLMARGVPYDSDGGRAWAGAISSLMTGWAYRASGRFAERLGPFPGYAENSEAMLGVVRKHRAAIDQIDPDLVPEGLLQAARTAWDEALALGERHGYRNSQASVIAPTGTIGLMMDCDTTGIEPDLALVKTKKLVGGGTMKIVNQTVPRALRRLGYSLDELDGILAHIHEHNTVEGAPFLKEDHYPVFDCAMGDRTIHYMGHVRMMAAVQPFISGAISKTVNMPESATVEEVEQLLVEGWRLGLKALALYRDNCKVAQPLSADGKRQRARAEAAVIATGQPQRRRLPKSRPAQTTSFRVGDAEGYINAGLYPDDGIGEIFLKVSKQGSTIAGVMDALAISVSLGLQYGVPLEAYVAKFMNVRFEPSGMTDDPDVRFATSIVDYVFRRLALDHLDEVTRRRLGIMSTGERRDAVNGPAEQAEETAAGTVRVAPSQEELATVRYADAPYCFNCGMKMQPAGSCFVCGSCGSTSGCS
ncbi:MAG: Hint domain-containing protein [Acidobacteria bacterium]|nr:Hint domain-containing protein [Acidobacteriota bacterium]